MSEWASKLLMSALLPMIQEILISLLKKVSPGAKAWIYEMLDDFYWWTKSNTWVADDELALMLLDWFGRPTPTQDEKPPAVYDSSLLAQ